MSSRPWYKRYPSDFVSGTYRLTAEEKGVYAVLLDLMYDAGKPIVDDAQELGRVCGCSTRRFNQIKAKLVEDGKIIVRDGTLDAPIIIEWALRGGREAIPKQVREFVFQRDGGVCRYCGSIDGPFHIDHIEPVSLGGSNHKDNLALACACCNLSKGSKRLSEWLQ